MPTTLTICPWPDAVLDTVGHDPRSLYVERFWLPTLGPTALLLMRHLAGKFDAHPRGIELPVADTSRALGSASATSSSSPILRSLARLETFDLACSDGHTTVAVRRNLPPATRRHLRRLPPSVQADHAAWAEARLAEPPLADARRRARRLALALLEEGDPADRLDHTLASMGFHPAVSHDAARWAESCHSAARRGVPSQHVAWGAVPAKPELDEIAAWIGAASQIVVLTGAGISTESGIPDFRGPQGLWTKNPAAEKTATLQYYVSDPEIRRMAWQNRLTSEMWQAEPNAGHRAIAELERVAALHTLVTQNVDGLHHAAGSSPDRIVEIHGTVHDAKCLRCGWRGPMGPVLERVRAGEDDPTCESCGGMLKSATISFGENLVAEDLERAQHAAQGADLFLAAGTSLGVYPAAALPEIALVHGARLVILNAQETPFDDVASAVRREPLGEVLPELVARVGAA